MISHIIVLSGLHHRPNTVRSVTATQFHFWHRPHLYYHSRNCLVWFLSKSTPNLIDHNSSISWKPRPHMYDRSCCFLARISSHITLGPIDHDSSVSFLAYNTLVRSTILLFYLVFIINHTLSNRSWQFNFYFDVDQTYMIEHIIVFSDFRHKLYLIQLVMAA